MTTQNNEIRRLNINPNYDLPDRKEGEPERYEGRELTEYFVNYAVNSTHKDGLEGQQRRMFARIQRKLTKAIVDKIDFIDLQLADAEFLRKAVDKCLVPSGLSYSFVTFEDEVELLKTAANQDAAPAKA